MKNSIVYKTFSEYKKNLTNININSLNIPNILERIIIIETINTGPNPKENNIIEISCIEMMGGKITGLEFDAYLHPRYSINEVTKQKTNLNNNFYEEYFKDVYSSDKNVLEQLKKFVNQSKIVSYNANKEMDFINNEFSYHKMNAYPKNKFYSVSNMIKQMFPKLNQNFFSLNKCCDFLEIRLPKEKFHTSKNECFAVAKIISKLYDIITDLEIKIKNENEEKNGNNIPNFINKINENTQYNSSKIKSDKNSKNNDNDFDYSDSFIDIIGEEDRNDENKSDNILNNNENQKKEKDKSDINYELSEKKEEENIKLLNNKRKLDGFDNLLNNLKNKVNPIKEEENKFIEINIGEKKFKQNEKRKENEEEK